MTDAAADDDRQAPRSARTVPLAWYDAETYEDIKAMMTDGQAFTPSYEKWEGHAKKVEAFFVAKGIATVRVHVDPREFAEWCRAHGRNPDANGRLAFSEWAARARANPKPEH